MSSGDASFSERVLRIQQQRSTRIRNGYVHEMRADGLIVARPRRLAPQVPWRGLAYLVCGFIAFKALVMFSIDPVEYDSRMAILADGTRFEQAAGFLMQKDPVSSWIVHTASSKLPQLQAALK